MARCNRKATSQAQLYGRDDSVYGGLGAFFLLMDKPEVYGLAECEKRGPSRAAIMPKGYLGAFLTAAVGVLAGLIAIRQNSDDSQRNG